MVGWIPFYSLVLRLDVSCTAAPAFSIPEKQLWSVGKANHMEGCWLCCHCCHLVSLPLPSQPAFYYCAHAPRGELRRANTKRSLSHLLSHCDTAPKSCIRTSSWKPQWELGKKGGTGGSWEQKKKADTGSSELSASTLFYIKRHISLFFPIYIYIFFFISFYYIFSLLDNYNLQSADMGVKEKEMRQLDLLVAVGIAASPVSQRLLSIRSVQTWGPQVSCKGQRKCFRPNYRRPVCESRWPQSRDELHLDRVECWSCKWVYSGGLSQKKMNVPVVTHPSSELLDWSLIKSWRLGKLL